MSNLFEMGGYEFYVWGSIGLGLATFAWNLLSPMWQRRDVMRQLVENEDDSLGEKS